MEIKVKDTRMHTLVSHYTQPDSHGPTVKFNSIPVAEAKLVLVKCKRELSSLYVLDSKILPYFPNDQGPIKGIGKYYKPILISETEKIEVGDQVFVNDLPHDPPSIFPVIKVEEGHSGVHGKIWISNNDYIVLSLCKKILALPEHFSSKHLQMIVDGELKDDDNVLIECQLGPILGHYDSFGEYIPTDRGETMIKYNTNNKIILHIKNENIVDNLFKWLSEKDYLSDDVNLIKQEWLANN